MYINNGHYSLLCRSSCILYYSMISTVLSCILMPAMNIEVQYKIVLDSTTVHHSIAADVKRLNSIFMLCISKCKYSAISGFFRSNVCKSAPLIVTTDSFR